MNIESIAFELHCDETPLFLRIADSLKKSTNFKITGVTLGNRWINECRDYEIPTENIGEFIENHWDEIDISYSSLKKIEGNYNVANLSFFILSDRFLINYDYDKALKYLVGHFMFYESFFEHNKIDVFISTAVASMSHLVCYTVAKKFGCKFFGLGLTRSWEERFVFIDNYSDSWSRVNSLYEKYMSEGLCPNDKKSAEEELDSFLKKPKQPNYMNSPRQSLGLRREFFVEFSIRMLRYYFQGWRIGSHDYITQHPTWYVFRDIKKILNVKIQSRMNIFDRPKKLEKFFLFPLHLQPEASTLILSPYYVNQIATIENIAKTLPAGTRLYVKEHISAFGRRSLSFYRNIKNIPNVKLLSPFEPTLELIKNSIAPIVLTSTVGWEALMLGKPVITLGNSFYLFSGLTLHAESFDKIPEIIANDIPEYRLDKEKLLCFIASIKNGSHSGYFNVPHMQSKKVLSQENVKKLVDGIVRELDILG